MLLSNRIAKTLVQENFFPLWRNFKGLLFVNGFHKWVEVTVIIFESVPGNATALSREKGFIPSATTKAPMWFVYIFCILNSLRTYKLLCTPVWVFQIITFIVNEYRLQLAFSSLQGLQKFQWSDSATEYRLQRKCICFDKLLFLNPNQNFIEFIMKSHW